MVAYLPLSLTIDVIKTRVQTQGLLVVPRSTTGEMTSLLPRPDQRLGAIDTAKAVWRTEGSGVFFRGLGICSARAFIVNAVQWAVYEWMMSVLSPSQRPEKTS